MALNSKWLGAFLLVSPAAFAQINLSPITKTGSAAEALEADPIVPSLSTSTAKDSGDGSILRTLEYSIPLSITDPGQPGNLSQLRGAGTSSVDVSVEAFGVPLNGAQGGGFDFSAFPQYLWSSLDYQSGPSLGAFDLRAVSGSVRLTPWSEWALDQPGTSLGASQYYSSLNVDQITASYHSSHQVAVVAGYGVGVVNGPALGFSSEWNGYRFHLIALHQDANSPGPIDFPSPNGKAITDRVIPVVEKQFDLSPVFKNLQLKSTLFYDGQRQQSQDLPGLPDSDAKIQQTGIQNAFLWGDWTLGASTRYTTYQDLTFQAPGEDVTNLQLSRLMEWDRFTLQPMLEGVWVTRLGLHPEGSLGGRYQIDQPDSVYIRLSYAEKFPTLVDRYSNAFEIPNPSLEPEKDLTAVAGVERKIEGAVFSLEQLAQSRSDAQVSSQVGQLFTETNQGSAYVYSTWGGRN